MKKGRFVHEFVLVLLLAAAVIAIAAYSNLNHNSFTTGDVIGSLGQQCDGNWTCGDWATCASGNQTRTCTSSNSVNCTSPITESQTCTVTNTTTNSTNSTSCTENWTCVNWTVCASGNQTRTCTDANSCGTTLSEPALSQICTVTNTTTNSTNSTCTESWTCGDWAICTSSGTQTRTCTDANSCGTTASEPVISQSCTCSESWTCGNWSDCVSGNQTRTCNDANNCGTNVSEPIIINTCVSASTTQTTQPTPVTCTPNWKCGDWQECVSGNQARACTDTNSCGTQDGIPATTQACTSAPVQNVTKTKANFFSIVGSAISGPIGQVGKFFTNKTNIFISAGVLAFLVCGFFAFRFFRKHKLKIVESK
jgi:hypothetical protein